MLFKGDRQKGENQYISYTDFKQNQEEIIMKKRILCAVLAVLMVLTAAACAKQAEPTAAPTAEPTAAPTAEPTAEPTAAPTDAATEPVIENAFYNQNFENGTLEEIIANYTYKDRVKSPNTIAIESDANGNKFMSMTLQENGKDCWTEVDKFDASAAAKVVIEVSLRTTGVVAGTTDSQYTFACYTAHQLKKDGVKVANSVMLFRINENDAGSDVTVAGTKVCDLSKTEWTKLRFVVDNAGVTKDGADAAVYPCTVYLYDEAAKDYKEVHALDLVQPVKVTRLTVQPKVAAKLGNSIQIDDLRIYEG